MALCREEIIRRRRSNQRRRLILEATTNQIMPGPAWIEPSMDQLTFDANYTQSNPGEFYELYLSQFHFNEDGSSVYGFEDPAYNGQSEDLSRADLTTPYTCESLRGKWTAIDRLTHTALYPRGWCWADSGESLIMTFEQATTNEIRKYANLGGTAYDVTNTTFFDDAPTEQLTLPAGDGNPRYVHFSGDGTVMIYGSVEAPSHMVYGTCATPWDITTWTKDGTFTPTEPTAGTFWFSNQGNILYNQGSNVIYSHALSTPFDVSTANATADASLNVGANKPGTQAWIAGFTFDKNGNLWCFGGDNSAWDQVWVGHYNYTG